VCQDGVLFVSVDLYVSLCRRQHLKCEGAIRLVYPPFFCKLFTSSAPTNKNLTELSLEIKQTQTAVSRWALKLDTCSLELFSHNDRYYHLTKYWPFVLHHPVYTSVTVVEADCGIGFTGYSQHEYLKFLETTWQMLSLQFRPKTGFFVTALQRQTAGITAICRKCLTTVRITGAWLSNHACCAVCWIAEDGVWLTVSQYYVARTSFPRYYVAFTHRAIWGIKL
jgi:hypothetical protein